MIENFDSPARLLLEALLNTLWQGMLIAVLVWLLLRLVNRLSATTRHAVWLVTLLTIGALPILAIVANRNDPATPIKPEPPKPAVQSATPAPVSNPVDPVSITSVIARLNGPISQGATQGATQGVAEGKISVEINPPARVQEQNSAQRGFDHGIGTSTVEAMRATPVVAATRTLEPPEVEERLSLWWRMKSLLVNAFSGWAPLALVGLWMALWAMMSWRVARSYRAVFRLRGRLEPAPAEHNGHVERLASLFGIKRPVQAFTSGQVVMPMTIGSLKPLIIMPADLAEDLSQSEFESVVAHELAHIKRWDYLTNMLQRVVQSYLFFHPAVWFICKQLTIERELACDDWAVKTCEPRRYASCLTKLVEALNESKPHPKPQMDVRVAATGIGGIVFGKHVISRRVEMILNRDRNATTAVSKPALLYSIGLVVMFVAVCSLISPVIAVPLGQKPAKQARKESKAAAPAKSQEFPSLPAVPSLPPEIVDSIDILADVPDVPDLPESPEATLPPAADVAQLPGAVIGVGPAVVGGVPGGVAVQPPVYSLDVQGRASTVAPAAPGAPAAPVATVGPVGPEPPFPAVVWAGSGQEDKRRIGSGQEDKRAEPALPESEMISLLVDVVKRDTDPNVRNEALHGLYRIRTDAGINALIQLYDGAGDAKVKEEIIRYLLRRDGGAAKVDNSKAIAKLVAIAKSEQNQELRNKAISYLGAVKGDEGANTLIQIYDSLQDQKMKQYVIRSLAQNGGRKAVDKLVHIAKNDSDPVVRQYAIRSLYNVDNRRYLELDRSRVGMTDFQWVTPRPFVFTNNGETFFHFDSKNWEEWQKNWQKNMEEQNEKIREMIEKMQLDGKLKIDEIQNKIRIEMPKIEIQIKDLKDKIKLWDGFDYNGAVNNQLRSQVANVESQLSTLLALCSNTDMKTVEMRIMKDALEKQLNNFRSLRIATTRPGVIRGKSATASPAPAPAPAPKVAVTSSTF
jgi:beta-lactamase regulating signal transducer with metallopeptidase domain/predicted SpoU family rRNA methylase